ncbi:Pseudouridine synthase RluC/RluD, partial [Penicillium alfredii]
SLRLGQHLPCSLSSSLLAPSARITSYLLRRGRIPPPPMALANIEPIKVPPPDPVEKAPDVVITPCDPWPAPYYLEGGLRRVSPYHYTYNTHCKERWRNRQLEDIFVSEFRDRPAEYYRNALRTGHVSVNGKPAGPTQVLRNGHVVSHTLHRHEPPVTSLPIGVIHEDDGLMVIDKPPGVPVHSAGRYHYNSVVEILRAERGHQFVPRPCNRLDRLTSGIMFIGKDPKAAEKIAQQLKARTVQKEYIARVKGKFPDGVMVCDQPIMSVSPKLGLNRVRATGKEATTKFRRLAYYPAPAESTPESTPTENHEQPGDGPRAATPPPALANESEGYSIVHCLPLTGRTHQIRVHLQFLGYPITNDPIYSNRRVFGPGLGQHEASADRDAEIIERLSHMGKTEVADSTEYRTHFTAAPNVPPDTDPLVVEQIMAHEQQAAAEHYRKRKGERLSGECCDVCGTELYSDPGVHELGIFLHAVAYADLDGGWLYRSKMPRWGLPPPGVDGPSEVPDWVSAPEGKEVIVGYGVIPTLNDDPEDLPRETKDAPGVVSPVLLAGVGVLNVSEAAPNLNEAPAQERAETTATS